MPGVLRHGLRSGSPNRRFTPVPPGEPGPVRGMWRPLRFGRPVSESTVQFPESPVRISGGSLLIPHSALGTRPRGHHDLDRCRVVQPREKKKFRFGHRRGGSANCLLVRLRYTIFGLL